MRRIIALIALGVIAWLVLRKPPTVYRYDSERGPAPAAVTRGGPATVNDVPAGTGGGGQLRPRTPVSQPDVGFRSRDRLDEHFAKHGAEFGGISKAQYLAMAQQLRDAEPGGSVLEFVRPMDGVVSRFDTRTGAFLAADRDGTIRTFFKPNDGERYFRRQANRPPSP